MINSILSIVNKFIPDPDEALKAATQMEQEMTKQMSLKASIIQSENANGSGKWRVRLMYLCMFIVAAQWVMYTFIPYMVILCELDIMVIPDPPLNKELWSFLKIGVGGYISSRGVEKSIAWFNRK